MRRAAVWSEIDNLISSRQLVYIWTSLLDTRIFFCLLISGSNTFSVGDPDPDKTYNVPVYGSLDGFGRSPDGSPHPAVQLHVIFAVQSAFFLGLKRNMKKIFISFRLIQNIKLN